MAGIWAVTAAAGGYVLEKGQSRTFPLDPRAGEITAEVTAATPRNRNTHGLGRAGWGVELLRDGHAALRATVRWGNTDLGGAFDTRYLRLTVDSVTPAGQAVELFHHDLSRDVDLFGGANELAIELSPLSTAFYVGSDQETHCGSLPNGLKNLNALDALDALNSPTDVKVPTDTLSLALRVFALATTRFDRVDLRERPDPSRELLLSPEALGFTRHDPREGVYTYLDRENDPAYALPGGLYTLRLIPDRDTEGGYLLLYQDGAETNPSLWHRGMVKARLRPTQFRDHFALTWYDASCLPLSRECSADFSSPSEGILTLSFPLYRTTLRFARR